MVEKKYLALDTANGHLTVLLRYNNVKHVYVRPNCQLQHSSQFMECVERVLEESGATLNDLDYFGVVVGPGSFTGIRIGISAIKAMCQATGKPFAMVTSFDLMAYNNYSDKCLCAIDAKHGSYYVCGYNGYQVDYPPSFVDEKTLDELCKKYDLMAITPLGKGEVICLPHDGLMNIIEEAPLHYDLDELVPLYVRKSQAEENR